MQELVKGLSSSGNANYCHIFRVTDLSNVAEDLTKYSQLFPTNWKETEREVGWFSIKKQNFAFEKEILQK